MNADRRQRIGSPGQPSGNRPLAMGLLVAGSLCPFHLAHAGSGFELRSQSASSLGSAQAGMTAEAADVSYIAFNPAALAYGEASEVALGVTGLFTRVKFSPGTASTILGTPIPGNAGGDAGTRVAVPNLYLGAAATDAVRWGIAVAPRFGLGSYWSEGWVGRYYALDSELTTIDIVPTLSWRPDRAWSLGIGIDIEYATIKTSSAIDFGTLDQVLTGGAFGGIPAGSDGSTSSDADSWAVGVRVGVIYEPAPGTRIGVNYHSALRHRFSGDATFAAGGPTGAGIAAVTGAFRDTSVATTFDMPAMAAIGIAHEWSNGWTLLGDVKWTDWSSFSTLGVDFGNPAQPPVTTRYAWRDSWFVTMGARYRFDERRAVRFGVAYDQSPTRDETRNPVIPDTDSYWLAAGVEYRFSTKVKLDVAYGHVFARDGTIAQSAATGANAFRGNLGGTVIGSSVDYIAVQLAYRF